MVKIKHRNVKEDENSTPSLKHTCTQYLNHLSFDFIYQMKYEIYGDTVGKAASNRREIEYNTHTAFKSISHWSTKIHMPFEFTCLMLLLDTCRLHGALVHRALLCTKPDF